MLRVNYILLVVVTLNLSSRVDSAKILGVFLYPSRQHEVLGTALFTELAGRGHEVTMISTNELASLPNKFPHVLVDCTRIRRKYSASLMSSNVSMWQHIVFTNSEMKYMVAELLEDANLRKFLDTGTKFDVVITDLFAEALLGISHRVNATTISFNPTGSSNALDYLSGNPHPYSYVPNSFTSFSDKMSFWQRFANTYLNVFSAFCKQFFNLPMQRTLLKQYFPDAPSLEDLMADVDLHLVNAHHLFETPRPLLPNVVPIGGFHLQKAELLTVELLKYLDECKNGVVLFTLGSHRRLTELPEGVVKTLFASLAQCAHQVLVQYEGPPLDGVPANVRLMTWLPQRAVLSHVNTKLFVTLGGRSSVAEAIHYGVPMLGLHTPDDDDTQLRLIAQRGLGICFRLDGELRPERLGTAIRDLVSDPGYKQAVMRESELFRRQEMNPLDKAIYWIEYVARHKGAKRVKSLAAAGMALYAYILLDVVVASLALLAAVSLISLWVCKQTFRALIRRRQARQVKHKIV